ncbi:hypothetical protein [Photorhabdus namnaonensis]|uniref:Uncharacterized protein n=1 Tax=Photorhabdus namnaonensis TaxID=1851568 RepID=A0A1B8YCP9_9GAMM|nr:hypothetical protein [Photorhabdus namnaonensis]OCA52944.1 hypothetical protein Phpb_03996 [Photorhabdus namnaonensis]
MLNKLNQFAPKLYGANLPRISPIGKGAELDIDNLTISREANERRLSAD